MKKLIITVAFACAAAFAQAANFTWGSGGGEWYDQNGDEMYGGTAFLYLGTVTASDTAFNTASATLITSSGFDSDQWVYGNYDVDNMSSSDLVTSTDAGQAYSIVLVNKAVSTLDGYEGEYTILTGSSARGQLPGATVTYYASFVNDTAPVTTSSTMGAVPEPTSGLLLLLGMAGLALKRKRA